MKPFTVAPEVKADIQKRIKELHQIAVANGIPLICVALAGYNEENSDLDKGLIAFEKFVSAHIDGRIDRAPDFMVAMSEIAQAPTVGAGLAAAIFKLGMMEDDDCDCPACTSRRAEDPEGEVIPRIH